RFPIRENGLTFLVGFGEGLSPGIFLDQRENRWRLLTSKLAGKSLLNCFSYTCAFSVAAAKAGATTASIDLSKNYLAWGKENFRANGLECGRRSPSGDPVDGRLSETASHTHQFLDGDVFEWLRRFENRQQRW